jgi:phage tail tape meausure protein lambda family
MARGNNNETSRNMSMVMQALLNNGLSQNQARAMAAEIGRENSFQSKYLWGYHKDPHNGAVNMGIISWQGPRARQLDTFMRSKGLMNGNRMEQSQRALDAQVAFMLHEMRTNKAYAPTKRAFLDNPNVDYTTAYRVLGKNYIGWRIDDPKYAQGHATRDNWYRRAGGVVPQDGGVIAPAGEGYSAPEYTPERRAGFNLMPQRNTVVGAFGNVTASNDFQNDLYGDVAAQGLPPEKEALATTAANTINDIYNKVFNAPLVKTENTATINALMNIFDTLDVSDGSQNFV